MYLSKIEIIGFKSFAQRINVNFDTGVTAIVGPNGCGKTNIVDAIRWALGEQRYSTLRSDKMEDVIFNGTKNRKPLGLAEVSLSIENTKGILPTEYSEVTITRRVFRSGESEYLLNKVPCRLKDILDPFFPSRPVAVLDNFDPFYPRALKERNIAAHRNADDITVQQLALPMTAVEDLDERLRLAGCHRVGVARLGKGPGMHVVHVLLHRR